MNKAKCIATPLIAVAMMTVPMMALAQSSQQGNATDNNASMATVPTDGAQAKAYRDGMEAAKLDTAAQRTIDAKKSFLFVNPPVKKDAREAYRTSFTAGYHAALAQGVNTAAGQ